MNVKKLLIILPLSTFLYLLCIFPAFLFPTAVQAAVLRTNVSGLITSDTIWTMANSPYIVKGNILVQNGATLTIEPGVQVLFDGAYRLQIEGQLIAIGTANNRIVFTSNYNPKQAGDWLGITFTDTSVDATFDGSGNYVSGSSIQFSNITYGGTLLAYSSSPSISHSRFAFNTPVGSPYPPKYPWDTAVLTFYNSTNAQITYNHIDNNLGGAIKLENGGGPTVFGNIIYKNSGGNWGAGIGDLGTDAIIRNNVFANNQGTSFPGGYFNYGGTPLLENNTFIENTSANFMWESDRGGGALGTWSNSLHVRGNTFVRNGSSTTIHLNRLSNDIKLNQNNFFGNATPYDIYISSYALSIGGIPPVNATNNFWATSSSQEVRSRIYNGEDQFGQPLITITPLVATPIITAPILPPTNVTVTVASGGFLLAWSANVESDLAGYKIYYDTDSGYPYTHMIDVGHVTTATLLDLSAGINYVAVTAYDTAADGTDDWTDGNESWFSSEVMVDLTPPTIQFSQAAYAVTEAANQVVITATLNKPYDRPVSATYSTDRDTARADSDYTEASGTLTFVPGQISQTFTVSITNDTLDELDETVNLILSAPISATLGVPVNAVLTIADDDIPPTVQFATSSSTVDESIGTATMTITLNAPSGLPISVTYATSDGTATAHSDYTTTKGLLTFTPGEISKNVTVLIVNDSADEDNESINLTLSDPINAILGTPGSTMLTIIDDDAPPTVQLHTAALSIAEGDATVSLHITLNHASELMVSIVYSTSDGTAMAGSDYTAVVGTATFVPGEVSRMISIPIVDDNILLEPAETFSVRLSNPANATIGAPVTATVTITENDISNPSAQVNAPTNPTDPVSISIITPIGMSQVIFDDVRASGVITILVSSTPPLQSPSNFTLLTRSFDVTNNGIDFGRATIHLPYRDADIAAAGVPEASLRLLHFTHGQWKDITTDLNTTANIITGVTESFSPFVLGVQNMQDCAISLNSGATYTARLNVQVFSNMPEAAQMLVSNDAGFTGAQWQLYQSALDWTITDAENRIVTLLVYARLRNATGNQLCSGLSISDDIIYDPLPPTVTVQLSQASVVGRQTGGSILLQLLAADQQGGSGVADMQISTNTTFAGARWQPFQSTAQVTAEPGDQIYVRIRDGVSNISNAAVITIAGTRTIFLPLIER